MMMKTNNREGEKKSKKKIKSRRPRPPAALTNRAAPLPVVPPSPLTAAETPPPASSPSPSRRRRPRLPAIGRPTPRVPLLGWRPRRWRGVEWRSARARAGRLRQAVRNPITLASLPGPRAEYSSSRRCEVSYGSILLSKPSTNPYSIDALWRRRGASRARSRGHGGGRRSRRVAGRSWSRGHGGWRRSRIAADQVWSRGHGGEVVEQHAKHGAADTEAPQWSRRAAGRARSCGHGGGVVEERAEVTVSTVVEDHRERPAKWYAPPEAASCDAAAAYRSRGDEPPTPTSVWVRSFSIGIVNAQLT
ncbi:hypothetical protein PVAP13_6KG030535 [Panicum virgatum]|uniref:Uncharacterized protein n=1 Tax=Panicum virgatum TaxID=38727 RepID=A0A8T0R6W1_PANVG|nr:hypothetical protein PVAP13_6KG030535 [Panicum virgatum]